MSAHSSHSPKRSLSPDGTFFTGNWLAEQGLADYGLDSLHADKPLANGSNTSALRTQATRESKVYGTRDWIEVPNTTDSFRPPPASLSKLVPPSEDFESWLAKIQSVSTLEHQSESRLRAAQDARLLAAIRSCHSAHKNHMRRLEDARALAINILRSPFVRRISAAQGVDLHMRADRRADARLLEIDGDSGQVLADGGSLASSEESHKSFSASTSVSMDDESDLSEESDESTGSPIVLSSDEYEHASPGEKRRRR